MHPAGLFCTNLKKAVDNSPFGWYNNTRRQGRHRLWGISLAGSASNRVCSPATESKVKKLNSSEIQQNQGFLATWGYSSAGRALEWHSRGQRFDPAYLHQKQ